METFVDSVPNKWLILSSFLSGGGNRESDVNSWLRCITLLQSSNDADIVKLVCSYINACLKHSLFKMISILLVPVGIALIVDDGLDYFDNARKNDD